MQYEEFVRVINGRESEGETLARATADSGVLAAKYLLFVALFGVALFVPALFADRIIEDDFPEPIRTQFQNFRAVKDDYDIVIVGSSLVRNQIDPAIFDATLRDEGFDFRTFNFGIGGMRHHETNVLLEHILELRGARLRYVVIDVGRFDKPYPVKDFRTRRYIWWHTPREAAMAFQRVLQGGRQSSERQVYLHAHLTHLGLRVFHVGDGPRFARHVLGRPKPDPEARPFVPGNAGYVALAAGPVGQRMDVDAYRMQMDVFRAQARQRTPLTPADVHALERQVETVRGYGVEPVYLITPVVVQESKPKVAVEEGRIPNLFAYDEVERYGQFYAIENRWDEYHLVSESAEELTRLFAIDFAAYLRDAR